MTPKQLLTQLAAEGHSRTSAHKAIGWSWHTFRAVAADYPEIKWRKPGAHMSSKWQVTFLDAKGEQLAQVTAECAYPHNAPKVAFKQLPDANAVAVKCMRVEVVRAPE